MKNERNTTRLFAAECGVASSLLPCAPPQKARLCREELEELLLSL